MLKHNKRMFAAVGTSSVVVSSGLLAWQMYNVKQTQSEIHELKEKLSIQQQKNQLNELSNEREGQSQYIKYLDDASTATAQPPPHLTSLTTSGRDLLRSLRSTPRA
jgi:cell division protein FtsL